MRPMPAVDVLEKLLQDPDFREGLVFDRLLAARPGVYAEVPAAVPAALQGALRRRGIHRLYCHQAEAFAAAIGGHDAVVVTPTASGKTLCYNLPVLTRIIEEPEARALYIFPTKALAQDQLAELTALCETLDCGIRTFTYDGDTAPNARLAIREAGHVVITNPDMLHAATPSGSSSSSSSSTSSSTSCTPTAASLAATWPTSCAV